MPSEMVEAVTLADPPAPGSGEVVLRMVAAPIHPADLLTIAGDYGVLPPLPAVPGVEGVGRVEQLGADVDHLRPGDLVLLPMGRGTWCERMTARAAGLFALPADGDPMQLAMASANPATAYVMLRHFVTLAPGEWAIQNAANSAVGQYLATLARAAGWRTVSVVRRAEAAAVAAAAGADLVLVDGPDLAARVAEATGGAELALAIDAVGGDATLRLADCLAEGGTVVNYGLLSGEPCRVSAQATVFRDVRLRGFWLARWVREASREERTAVFREVVARVVAGDLRSTVEATYLLGEAKAAVGHAMRGGRGGKILFVT